jgi:hypothetical protein
MSQKQIYEQNEWFEATNDEHLTLLVVYCFEFLLRENFNIKYFGKISTLKTECFPLRFNKFS